MRYTYDWIRLREILEQILEQQLESSVWKQLQQKKKIITENFSAPFFYLTFSAIPRITGKRRVEEKFYDLPAIRKQFTITGWTIDRLARAWWLLHLPVESRAEYVNNINRLFSAADMNELIALYSALPLYAYPHLFAARATEGIRANIATVLDAVMLNNPYPCEYLDEAAWNQLVLKAFFTDKPVRQIIGLDERVNKFLAIMLNDYARERWAANRSVNPQLWRPMGGFLDENIFPSMQKLFLSDDILQQQAAALCCAASDYVPAKNLLAQYPELKKNIEQGILSWDKF